MLSRLKLWFFHFLRLNKVYRQTLYGVWKITGVPAPRVTIFGSARLEQDDPYAKQAHKMGVMLVENKISVLTGGGPGIMEAANCGAVDQDAKVKSIGISVEDLGEGINPCAQISLELRYFFARKWLLTRYSSAFIVFPGGFGTLDEMAEVITMVQTKRIAPVPIVLVGVEYWEPFMHWLESEALKHGTVSTEDIALFTITDDLDQAFCLARDECAVTK